MFEIGDKINYGINGVCTLEGVRREKIGRETHEYYVLRPVMQSRSTICVPVDNAALVAKMMPLISREELDALIRELPDLPAGWIENDLERTQEFKRILRTADRRSIFSVIKSIYAHEKELSAQNRRLKNSDQQIMKEAEAILYHEFAQVLSIRPEEVLPYLIARIENADPS